MIRGFLFLRPPRDGAGDAATESAIVISRRVSRASPSSAKANSSDAASTLESAIFPFDHSGIGSARMCRIMSSADVNLQ